MTEKLVKRGVSVPSDYHADLLAHIPVSRISTKSVMMLDASMTLADVHACKKPTSHHGFPVLHRGVLIGVVTLRDIFDAPGSDLVVMDLIPRAPITALETATVRSVADLMARHQIGRVPIVDTEGNLTGIVTRSDILAAGLPRIRDRHDRNTGIRIRPTRRSVLR